MLTTDNLNTSIVKDIPKGVIQEVLSLMPADIDCYELRFMLQQIEEQIESSAVGFGKFSLSKEEEYQPIPCIQIARTLSIEISSCKGNLNEFLVSLDKLLGPEPRSSRDNSPLQSPHLSNSPHLLAAPRVGLAISRRSVKSTEGTPNSSPRPEDNNSPRLDEHSSPRITDSPRDLDLSRSSSSPLKTPAVALRSSTGSGQFRLALDNLISSRQDVKVEILHSYQISQNAITPREQFVSHEGKQQAKQSCLSTVVQLEGLVKQLYRAQARLGSRHLSEVIDEANRVFILFNEMFECHAVFLEILEAKASLNIGGLSKWWDSLSKLVGIYNEFELKQDKRIIVGDEQGQTCFEEVRTELSLMGRKHEQFVQLIQQFQLDTTSNSTVNTSVYELFLEHFLNKLFEVSNLGKPGLSTIQKNIKAILACESLKALVGSLGFLEVFVSKNPHAKVAVKELDTYIRNYFLCTGQHNDALVNLSAASEAFFNCYNTIYKRKSIVKVPRKGVFDYKLLLELFSKLIELIRGYNIYCEVSGLRTSLTPALFEKLLDTLKTIKAKLQQGQGAEQLPKSEEDFVLRLNAFFAIGNEHRKKISSHLIEHILMELATLPLESEVAAELKVLIAERGGLSTLVEGVVTFGKTAPHAKVSAMILFERAVNKEKFKVENEVYMFEEDALQRTCEAIKGFTVVPEFAFLQEPILNISQKVLSCHVFHLVNHTKRRLESSLFTLSRMSGSTFLFLGILRDKGKDFRYLHQAVEQYFADKTLLIGPFLEFHEAIDELVKQEIALRVYPAIGKVKHESQEFETYQATLEPSLHNSFFIESSRAALKRKLEFAYSRVAKELDIKPENLFFSNGQFNVGGWSTSYLLYEMGNDLSAFRLQHLSGKLKDRFRQKSDLHLLKESCYGIEGYSQRKNGILDIDKQDEEKLMQEIISIDLIDEINRFLGLVFCYETDYKIQIPSQCQSATPEAGASFVEFIKSNYVHQSSITKGTASDKGLELGLKIKFLGSSYFKEIEDIYLRTISPKAQGLVFANYLLEVLGKLNSCIMTVDRWVTMSADTDKLSGTLDTLLDVHLINEVDKLMQNIDSALNFAKSHPDLKDEKLLLLKLEEYLKIFRLGNELFKPTAADFDNIPMTARARNAGDRQSPGLGSTLRVSRSDAPNK